MPSYISFLCEDEWTEMQPHGCFSMFASPTPEWKEFYAPWAEDSKSRIAGIRTGVPKSLHQSLDWDAATLLLEYLTEAEQFGGIIEPEYDDMMFTIIGEDSDPFVIGAAGSVMRNLIEYPCQSRMFKKLVDDGADKDYAFLYAHAHGVRNDLSELVMNSDNHVPVYFPVGAKSRQAQAVKWKNKGYTKQARMDEAGYTGISSFYCSPECGGRARPGLALKYDKLLEEINSIEQ